MELFGIDFWRIPGSLNLGLSEMISEMIFGTFWDRLLEDFKVSKTRSFGDDFRDDVWNFSGSTFREFRDLET